MRNNSMNNPKLAVILSFVAITGVLSVWLLWLFGSMELAVVSLDTFVGVIVALLAVIVTVILGWQIVNALELQGKMREIEQRQDSMLDIIRGLSDNVQNAIKLSQNLQSGVNGIDANMYILYGQFVEAFVFYHAALCQAIMADQPNLHNRIEQLGLVCKQIVNPPIVDFSSLRKQLDLDSQYIKKSEAYRKYLSTSYEQIMGCFWDKMHSFGLQ